MAGKITVSTINDDTGVLATQNGMSGIAKAWVNFNSVGTLTIRSLFNVSSVTDNGVGDFTVNFITAMPDANYVVTGSAQWNGASSMPTVEPYNSGAGTKIAPTSSAFRFVVVGSGALAQIQDSEIINISVFR